MNRYVDQIEAQITNREFKKAEISIARLFRSNLPPSEIETLRILRARVRLYTGRPDDALEDIIAVQRLHSPENRPTLLELAGDIYFARFELASVGFSDRNDTIEAMKYYDQLLHEFPDYSNRGWILYQIGRIALTENRASFARENFQKALLNPSHSSSLTAFCYERLGYMAYYDERDLNKAKDFLSRAIATYPQSENSLWLVQVHILLSRVHKALGNIGAAIQAAERALTTASLARVGDKRMYSEALLNIGELLSEIENHESLAISYFHEFMQTTKRPIGIDVTWSRVNEMLGNAQFRLGNYDVAAEAYAAALELNPDHPWEVSLYHRLAQCHYHKQSYHKVIEIIQLLLGRTSREFPELEDYRIFDLLGNAHFALQNYNEALTAYETAIKMVPNNSEYRNQIKQFLEAARHQSKVAFYNLSVHERNHKS